MRRRLTSLATLAFLVLPTAASAQEMESFTVEVGARSPAVSPDGSTIAMSILGSIWTTPPSGGEAHRLTQGSGWDRHPAWSPDGLFLAYSRWTTGGSQLVLRNMETGLEMTLHDVPQEILQIEFSPDGRHVYFIRQNSQYDAHLWSIPVEGGQPRQITFTENWHEWSFALSPEGDEVLVDSGRYEGTEVFVLNTEDLSAERITDTPARETAVAWSDDGRRRAWIAQRDGVDRVMVSADGGAARGVHRRPAGQSELVFDRDGDLLLANARELFRIDPVTGTATAIPVRATFERGADPADDWALINVRLFDAVGDEAVEGSYVVVRDGRIAEVGTGTPDTGDLRVVDGRGRTLLPSLMDNHYHFWSPHQGQRLLAGGVTAVRDPGVAIADGMDYKDAIRHGLIPGPDIFSAGPLLDGPGGYHPMVDIPLETPEAAAPLVRALKRQGVDALKAYFLLEPDVLAAVVAEAVVQGLPVTGHIGVRTSWGEAMDAGIDGFSHVRVWKDFLDPEVQPDGTDESLDSSRDRVARMQADWTAINPESAEVEALIRRLAETGTAIDPTLAIQRIPDQAREQFSIEEFAAARESFERMQAFVRKAVEAGVPLLAGTDNVGLNNELEVYEDAGISNAAILKAATVAGARWIGAEGEFGTVEVGKRANLLLVDGDPLGRIRDLREIDLVLKDGVVVFRRGN